MRTPLPRTQVHGYAAMSFAIAAVALVLWDFLFSKTGVVTTLRTKAQMPERVGDSNDGITTIPEP